MEKELERYLNDHLGGSSGAVLLIQDILETLDNPEAKAFFSQLKDDVEADRALLSDLLVSIGSSPSNVLQAAGNIAARVGFIKLAWEGFKPGQLGMLEAMEMLALGVQGKRMLWRALAEIAPHYPEWDSWNFVELEEDALRQRNGVEKWRLDTVRASFASSDR